MAKKILLADDSVTIQKVVELTFMDEDYEVVATSDGSSALERLPEVAPDLVIADVHMPQTDGYEVCRQTKQNHPGIPVLLLVGTFEQFDEAKATAVGADGHLKKPFDSQDLLTQVEALIADAVDASTADANTVDASTVDASTADASIANRPEVSEGAVEPIVTDEPVVAELEPPMLMDEVKEPGSPVADTRPTARRSFVDPVEDIAEVEAPVASALVSGDVIEDVAEDAAASVVESAESSVPANIFETTPGDFKAPDFTFGASNRDPLPEVEPVDTIEPSVEAAGDHWADAGAIEAPAMEEMVEPSTIESPALESHASESPAFESPAFESSFEVEAVAADSGESPLAEAVDLEAPALESSPDPVAEPEPVAAVAVPTPDQDTVSEVTTSDVAATNGSKSLTDEDVDRIAKRVAEIIGEKALREVAWEVIPDLAEVIIKERIRELESQVE